MLIPISYSQSWNIEWQKLSEDDDQDYFIDILQSIGGSYVVLGSTGMGVSADACIYRFSESGDNVWFRRFEHPGLDMPQKIIAFDNDDILILIHSVENEKTTTLLKKTDKSGNNLWDKILEGHYFGNDIIPQKDGFIIVGSKKVNEASQPWMAKMNNSGEMEWEKTYISPKEGHINFIKQLPNEQFILGGQVKGAGKNNCDMLVIRTDQNGTELWSSHLDSPQKKELPKCICCSSDSNFIVVGWTGTCLNDINSEFPVFDFDLVIKKLSPEGKTLWTKSFDSEGSEGGNTVCQMPDGNFIVAGTKATSISGKIGPWLLRIDTNGEVLDEIMLNLRYEQASKIIPTSDGGFVVIGPGVFQRMNIRSNGWIVKFSGFK